MNFSSKRKIRNWSEKNPQRVMSFSVTMKALLEQRSGLCNRLSKWNRRHESRVPLPLHLTRCLRLSSIRGWTQRLVLGSLRKRWMNRQNWFRISTNSEPVAILLRLKSANCMNYRSTPVFCFFLQWLLTFRLKVYTNAASICIVLLHQSHSGYT